jgi:uncharacterized LabA/DUF88 family protein
VDRVAIFCDSANLYHGMARNFPGSRVDYAKLFDTIVTPDRRLMRVYWYTGVPVVEPQARDKQKFIAYLQGVPYVEVRQKRLAPYQEGGQTKYREKGVDVWLAVDMVHMAYRDLYDVAALISGDADLVPAVIGVKDAGKHVENYYLRGSQSLELRQQVDKSIEMDVDWLSGIIPPPTPAT